MRLRLVSVTVMLVAACGGGGLSTARPTGPAASQPSVTPPGSTATLPPAPVEIAMCTLMPLGDVQSASPFSTPLAESEPGTPPSMCEYSSAMEAEEPVSVLLVATDFGSTEAAQLHMAAYREQLADAGVVLAEVLGVGDQATSNGTDEVGVHAITGRYALDANFGGEWPDTPDAAKVAAGISLLQTLISRLP